MTQMIMINYDFISDNPPNQCHQRSICILRELLEVPLTFKRVI